MYIETKEYENMLDKLPICCIDIILKNKKGDFLILKRSNEPAKEKWWIPGGRIYKNENFEIAAKRKIKEETGLDSFNFKTLGVVETIFDTGPFGKSVHTINVMGYLETDEVDVIMDKQSEHYRWLSKIDNTYKLHEEIIKYLRRVGY
jgi:colanic acid biosynthesis protein WcaH